MRDPQSVYRFYHGWLSHPTTRTLLVLLAPTLLFSGGLFLVPLCQAVLISLQPDQPQAGPLANYVASLSTFSYHLDLWFTLAIGLGTVVACTVIALPLALILRQPFWGRNIVWLLLLIPLATPHIIAAYMLQLTLSSASPFTFWLFQGGDNHILFKAWPGLWMATTWKFFPVMLLSLSAALQGLPSNYEEAARDLGANRWQRIHSILLPLIAPGWLAGATLTFVLATSQFTMTLIIYGLSQQPSTIPLDVYLETFAYHRPGRAATLGVILMVMTLLLVALVARKVRRQSQPWSMGGVVGLGARSPISPDPIKGNNWRSIMLIIGISCFVLGPVLCLFLYSLTDQWTGGTPFPSGLTLRWYGDLFRYDGGLSSLGQSTLIAMLTACLTVVVALPAAYAIARYTFWGRNYLEGFLLAKVATPVIVIGVGTAALFYRWNLSDTLLGLVLAHSIGALPLTLRSFVATLERSDRAQEESAQDLGAPPLTRFWSIVFPPAIPGIIGGATLAFLHSLDEFIVTFLISGAHYVTLPLRLYNALNQSSWGSAAAAAIILLIPSFCYLAWVMRGLQAPFAELSLE